VRTIWKFPIEPADKFRLDLPKGARFLSVQMQHGEPQSWWLVDPTTNEREARRFRVHGTGHEVDGADRLVFLGTFQLAGGALVFHLFEES
jgi:hypothetical protein